MARVAVACSVGVATPGSQRLDNHGHIADPVAGSSYATDKTAFEAALATLVADGASPTQAHVTSANSAYNTFKADLAAPPTAADIVLSVDLAKISSVSALELALKSMCNTLRGNKALSL